MTASYWKTSLLPLLTKPDLADSTDIKTMVTPTWILDTVIASTVPCTVYHCPGKPTPSASLVLTSLARQVVYNLLRYIRKLSVICN
jgi:hypothetical protein